MSKSLLLKLNFIHDMFAFLLSNYFGICLHLYVRGGTAPFSILENSTVRRHPPCS